MKLTRSDDPAELPRDKTLSGEALLISALVNTGDVGEAARCGVTPGHIIGYPQEYNWLIDQASRGESPSKSLFKHRWPEFPLNEHADVAQAAAQVFRHYYRMTASERMQKAIELFGADEDDAAFEQLSGVTVKRVQAKPTSLLSDRTFLDSWGTTKQDGIAVPYPALQHATGGIHGGNLWYLAARLGQGKSGHLLNIAKAAYQAGETVKFYSCEMSAAEVRGRLHAQLAHELDPIKFHDITVTKLRQRQVDMELYKEFLDDLEAKGWSGKLDIHTPRDGAVTPAMVQASVDDYSLIAVDHVGLMQNNAGMASISDWRVAAEISNSLKQVSLSAPRTGIIAAAQLNREGDSTDWKKAARLSQLSQTDALGQDGDVVIMLRTKFGVASVLDAAKNRHGQEVRCYTEFDPDTGKYAQITEEQAEERVIAREEKKSAA